MLKRCIKLLLGLAALGAVGGFVAVWIGMAPISASAGHWPITDWLLHFAMRESVQTRALRIKTPALDDRAMVQRGAGHYARGCAACHGAPGDPRPLIALQMTPHPPDLEKRIDTWKPRELFWIVKNGVKFTGMPAWPAQQRDDEVWAVVAFLLRLPDLTPAEYQRLAYGEMAVGAPGKGAGHARLQELSDPLRDVLEDCARCHGKDGLGRAPGAFPRLSYQTERYLYESLRAYADGVRFSGIMQPIAAGLSQRTMAALARHYAEAGPAEPPPAAAVDQEMLDRGEQIAKRGIARQGVASCVDCHGPAPWRRNPVYPLLAAQDPDYLVTQLQLFKEGRRGGTGHAHIMDTSVNRLDEQQMRDVAEYYGALPPERAQAR